MTPSRVPFDSPLQQISLSFPNLLAFRFLTRKFTLFCFSCLPFHCCLYWRFHSAGLLAASLVCLSNFSRFERSCTHEMSSRDRVLRAWVKGKERAAVCYTQVGQTVGPSSFLSLARALAQLSPPHLREGGQFLPSFPLLVCPSLGWPIPLGRVMWVEKVTINH